MPDAWGNDDGGIGVPIAHAGQDMVSPGQELLTVGGLTTCNGGLEVNDDTTLNNTLTVEGIATFNDEVRAADTLRIWSDAGINKINTTALGALIGININEEAGNVLIGKPDSVAFDNADVIVQSPRLKVGNVDAEGNIDAVLDGDVAAQNLNIGTGGTTADVLVGNADHEVSITSKTLVGTAASCMIDTFGQMDLLLGTDANHTQDLILSRVGQTTRIKGSATVGDGVDGFIDASDGDNRDMKIGTTVLLTKNVVLGRAGKRVDCNGLLKMGAVVQMNSNDLVLGSSATAAGGSGLALQDMGNGVFRINVFVGGVLVGYHSNVPGFAWVELI